MMLRPGGAPEAAPVKLLSQRWPMSKGQCWGQGFRSSPLICLAAHPYRRWTVSGLLIHDKMAFVICGLSEHKLGP